MKWGTGAGESAIMTVRKLRQLLGELVDLGKGDLYVHGVANRSCMYAGRNNFDGLGAEFKIDFVNEAISDMNKTLQQHLDGPSRELVPVDGWYEFLDRIPDGIRKSMYADPPEGSFGIALFEDGHIGVEMSQGQGGGLVWEEDEKPYTFVSVRDYDQYIDRVPNGIRRDMLVDPPGNASIVLFKDGHIGVHLQQVEFAVVAWEEKGPEQVLCVVGDPTIDIDGFDGYGLVRLDRTALEIISVILGTLGSLDNLINVTFPHKRSINVSMLDIPGLVFELYAEKDLELTHEDELRLDDHSLAFIICREIRNTEESPLDVTDVSVEVNNNMEVFIHGNYDGRIRSAAIPFDLLEEIAGRCG